MPTRRQDKLLYPLVPETDLLDTFAMRSLCTMLRCLLLMVVTTTTPAAFASELTVFAAASLKEALDEVADNYMQATGTEVTLSYAGSSTLARQIAYGAPADIFISANIPWMDRLEAAENLVDQSRINLLGNTLVVIARREKQEPDMQGDVAVALSDIGEGKVAMAFIDAVPAGIYGKAALKSLDLWDKVSEQVVQTDNVRTALALVALGAASRGIVYVTDARAENRVKVLADFPTGSHPEIRYPAAVLSTATHPQARDFLDYLQSESADDVFTDHGFLVIAE